MAGSAPIQQTSTFRQEWKFIIQRYIGRTLLYAIALLIAFLSILPLIWTLSTSFKQGLNVMTIPPRLIPNPLYWQNYSSVLAGFGGRLPFGRWLRNSLMLTGINIFGEILFAAVAAFGFSRFQFRLRKAMLITMVAAAMVPGMVRLLPQYMMFSRWGWTNTYLPLIVPNWLGGTFLTFMFTQYFVTIPRELDESAKIDGASNLDVFFRIVLPLSKPLISTAIILVYMSNWNNFLGPFIYLHSYVKYTLAVGLQYLQTSAYQGVQKEPLLSAYAILMALPLITIFALFQRYFVQGIQLSVSKG